MKKSLFIYFFLLTFFSYSQKKVLKRFELLSNQITINTDGLDNLKIENSNSNQVEVILLAESYDDQIISLEESKLDTKISFHFEGTETREVIFRKFITKRLQRSEAVVKLPKNKKVSIYGSNVDIQSNNCENELSIYIDNGIVKLNTIKDNTTVKLYSGNVYGKLQDYNLKVKSNLGKIKINKNAYQKNYTKNSIGIDKNVLIESIKANVFLTQN